MGEWNFIILAPIGAACFAIGGTGFKWMRRFVLPAIMVLLCLINGIVWWQWLAMGICSIIAYCLPYGDSLGNNWWSGILRSLVIASYFGALCWIGISWFMLIAWGLLTFMFIISKLGSLTWKVWELTTGFLIGITLASLL